MSGVGGFRIVTVGKFWHGGPSLTAVELLVHEESLHLPFGIGSGKIYI